MLCHNYTHYHGCVWDGVQVKGKSLGDKYNWHLAAMETRLTTVW